MIMPPSGEGVTLAQSMTSENMRWPSPDHAASPTRSWLSCVVIMDHPAFSVPTRFSAGTITSS